LTVDGFAVVQSFAFPSSFPSDLVLAKDWGHRLPGAEKAPAGGGLFSFFFPQM